MTSYRSPLEVGQTQITSIRNVIGGGPQAIRKPVYSLFVFLLD
jgi:hypothetical protein